MIYCEVPILVGQDSLLCIYLYTLTITHTHTHSLSLVLVVMMKAKGLKTKISHTHSLILSHPCTHSSTLHRVTVVPRSHDAEASAEYCSSCVMLIAIHASHISDGAATALLDTGHAHRSSWRAAHCACHRIG